MNPTITLTSPVIAPSAMAAPVRSGYTLRVIRHTAQLETIRGDWAALQRHPNADIDFYRLINELRASVIRPHVVLLEEGGLTRAMLIGRIERVPLECRIGYLNVMRPEVRALTIVYGGILGETSPAMAEALVNELYSALQYGEAEVVRLSGLAPAGMLCHFARHRPPLLCRDHRFAPVRHWSITLPASFEEFLARFKSKRRNEFRRMERLFETTFQGRIRYRIFTAQDEVEALCRDAEAVARLTYQRGMGAGFVCNLEHRRRFALAAAQGHLRAYLIYLDGKPCAFEIGVRYGDTFHLEYTGYDPALRRFELGTLVFMKAIADLCGSGVGEVDCGIGDAAYKRHYGDRCWRECAVLMFAPTLRGRWINTVRTLALGVGRLAEAVSRCFQLERRIKRGWRTLLARRGHAGEGRP